MTVDVRFEPGATLGQRQAPNVVVAIAQQVEGDDGHRLGLVDELDLACARQMDAALEPLKSRRTFLLVERDNLRINQQRGVQVRPKLLEFADDRRELMGLFVAETRPHANAVAADGRRNMHEGTDSVVLGLVEQAFSGQRRVCQRREHRPHARRVFAPFHRG